MNSYSYIFTELAATDIETVISYIDGKLCNKKAATDLYCHINNVINKASQFPYMYEDCNQFMISDETIRRALVDNYIMIYEVNDEDEMIIILRFLHHTRNIKELGLS